MYVVAGATGRVGSVVADALLRAGKDVRIVTRSHMQADVWRGRGAEPVIGSLADRDVLARALVGVDGVFLLLPVTSESDSATTFFADQRYVAEALAHAVKASHVRHVLFLSSIGAHVRDGTGPAKGRYYAERLLSDCGAITTIVRAARFSENFERLLAPMVEHGVLPTFVRADVAEAFVSARDVGRVVAGSLMEMPPSSEVIELSGPHSYTPADVARVFSVFVGHTVVPVQVPDSDFIQTLCGLGLSPGMVDALAEMYDALNNGRIAFEHPDAVVRCPTLLEEVAQDLVRRTNRVQPGAAGPAALTCA
jgi:uncharacterized protein YbjT (DUF2867 family)